MLKHGECPREVIELIRTLRAPKRAIHWNWLHKSRKGMQRDGAGNQLYQSRSGKGRPARRFLKALSTAEKTANCAKTKESEVPWFWHLFDRVIAVGEKTRRCHLYESIWKSKMVHRVRCLKILIHINEVDHRQPFIMIYRVVCNRRVFYRGASRDVTG